MASFDSVLVHLDPSVCQQCKVGLALSHNVIALQWDHPSHFLLTFQLSWSICFKQRNFANGGIQTADLWCRRRPLQQLCYNHCHSKKCNTENYDQSHHQVEWFDRARNWYPHPAAWVLIPLSAELISSCYSTKNFSKSILSLSRLSASIFVDF